MSQTAKELLKWGIEQLSPILLDDANTDARVLLADAMGIDRGMLPVKLLDKVDADKIKLFHNSIGKRLNRQPVAQIIGCREFWGRKFIVTPDVLDPRPDTEALIEEALKKQNVNKILDIGTGSGCILLTLLSEWPDAIGIATDISNRALKVAQQNARDLGVCKRVTFIQSDWYEKIDEKFDLIVCNPPYITEIAMESLQPEVRKWEPHIALTPGGDGLEAYREIALSVEKYLNPNGHLILEIGYDQADSVREIFANAGYRGMYCRQDLAGKDRIIGFSL